MRGKTNTDLYSGISINATTDNFTVGAGENILAGDFVQYEYVNETITCQNLLRNNAFKLPNGNFIGNVEGLISIFDKNFQIISQYNVLADTSVDLFKYSDTIYIFRTQYVQGSNSHLQIIQVNGNVISLLYDYPYIDFCDIVRFNNKYFITRGGDGYLSQLYLYNWEDLSDIQLEYNILDGSYIDLSYNDSFSKLFVDPQYYRLFFSVTKYDTSNNKKSGQCTFYMLNLNIDNHYGDYSSSSTDKIYVVTNPVIRDYNGSYKVYYTYRSRGQLIGINIINELSVQALFLTQAGNDTALANVNVFNVFYNLSKYESGLSVQYGYYINGNSSYNIDIPTTEYNDMYSHSNNIVNNIANGIISILYSKWFLYLLKIRYDEYPVMQLLDTEEVHSEHSLNSSYLLGYVAINDNNYMLFLSTYERINITKISDKLFLGATGDVKSFYSYDINALGVAAESGTSGDTIDVYIPNANT